MNWTIRPYEGVGPLYLGQTRESVRSELGTGYESFAKDVGENLTDAYDDLGVHLYYTDDDTLEFIEFFEPAQVLYRDCPLLERPFVEVQNELDAAGYVGRASDVGYGYDYDALGIAFTLSDEDVDGVAVYRRGYYD